MKSFSWYIFHLASINQPWQKNSDTLFSKRHFLPMGFTFLINSQRFKLKKNTNKLYIYCICIYILNMCQIQVVTPPGWNRCRQNLMLLSAECVWPMWTELDHTWSDAGRWVDWSGGSSQGSPSWRAAAGKAQRSVGPGYSWHLAQPRTVGRWDYSCPY